MPAELEGHRHLAQVEAAEDEGVENLAGGSLVEALGVGRVLVVDVAAGPHGRFAGFQVRIAVGFAIAVGMVVPGCGTDAEAVVALVDQVEFAEQVESVGDDVAGICKAVFALVEGRVVADAVGVLGAHAEVVAQGVVPADGQVGILGRDFHRRRATSHGTGDRDHQGA
ncbi:hypothetical protein D3C84_873490 [compost metagenome]